MNELEYELIMEFIFANDELEDQIRLEQYKLLQELSLWPSIEKINAMHAYVEYLRDYING